EHKKSREAINWNKDSFHGRLSFGMSALAKQTLEKKNIIRTLSPAKKTTTILNPAAAAADSFEEAEEIIRNKVPEPAIDTVDPQPEYITYHVPGIANSSNNESNRLKLTGRSLLAWPGIKTSMKLLFYYIILAIGAVVAGALITFLLGLLV
ncbi:MAG TPA: hypothetical protein VM888_03875, partial [Chitinophagaceae bacterium]|nr:hypothetical protein [Chitinophagaceae bacterium]